MNGKTDTPTNYRTDGLAEGWIWTDACTIEWCLCNRMKIMNGQTNDQTCNEWENKWNTKMIQHFLYFPSTGCSYHCQIIKPTYENVGPRLVFSELSLVTYIPHISYLIVTVVLFLVPHAHSRNKNTWWYPLTIQVMICLLVNRAGNTWWYNLCGIVISIYSNNTPQEVCQPMQFNSHI